MTKPDTMQLISDLVMAMQNGTPKDQVLSVSLICSLICGEPAGPEDMREYIDANWGKR